jgi:hypothetical protein
MMQIETIIALYLCSTILSGVAETHPADNAKNKRRGMALHFEKVRPEAAHPTTHCMNRN